LPEPLAKTVKVLELTVTTDMFKEVITTPSDACNFMTKPLPNKAAVKIGAVCPSNARTF